MLQHLVLFTDTGSRLRLKGDVIWRANITEATSKLRRDTYRKNIFSLQSRFFITVSDVNLSEKFEYQQKKFPSEWKKLNF